MEESFEDELLKADPETQRDMVETWFRERFEDPAERTPYETAEGGYQWIWGGPYDAREELDSNFSQIIPADVIEGLADELNGECSDWAPTCSAGDYDDYLVEDIAQITEFHHNFREAILNVEKLLQMNVDTTVADCFYRILYLNVITALETYLSDAFINTVVNKSELMRRFIETTPEFQSKKISYSDVFKAAHEIEAEANKYLSNILWHNLARVKPMYSDTLGIKFPSDSGGIFRAILTRHDIAHRNGKSKSGDNIVITHEIVKNIISAVEMFVEDIDGQFNGEI